MTALRSRLAKLENRGNTGALGFIATVPEALDRAEADRQVRAGIEAHGADPDGRLFVVRIRQFTDQHDRVTVRPMSGIAA